MSYLVQYRFDGHGLPGIRQLSIEQRIIDAKLLYDHGRFEGALLSVLVGAAGTSRLRFPRGTPSKRKRGETMRDGEAFEAFMNEEMRRVGECRVFFNGECNSAERIFYKWLRCTLAHEAKLPDQIVFRADCTPRHASLKRDVGPPERLIVTYPMVLLIGHVVCSAPENSSIPDEVRRLMFPA